MWRVEEFSNGFVWQCCEARRIGGHVRSHICKQRADGLITQVPVRTCISYWLTRKFKFASDSRPRPSIYIVDQKKGHTRKIYKSDPPTHSIHTASFCCSMHSCSVWKIFRRTCRWSQIIFPSKVEQQPLSEEPHYMMTISKQAHLALNHENFMQIQTLFRRRLHYCLVSLGRLPACWEPGKKYR